MEKSKAVDDADCIINGFSLFLSAAAPDYRIASHCMPGLLPGAVIQNHFLTRPNRSAMPIRKALPADNSGAKALVQKSLTSFGLVADFAGLDAAIGSIGLANTPNEIELVAEVDGKLVGCLAVQCTQAATAKIFGFHVDASAQGKGVGRALLMEGIAQAVACHFTRLELETWGDMRAAVHLYESFGWVRGPDPLPESGADRFYYLALPSKPCSSCPG